MLISARALESANGKLQATEWFSSAFGGPPLGAFLFTVAVGLPFIFDGVSFFLAAGLVATIAGTFAVERIENQSIKAEIGDGLKWLWGHTVLRTLSLMAGVTNLVAFGVMAIFVLFAQDIVGLGDIGYGVLIATMGLFLVTLRAVRMNSSPFGMPSL